MKEPEVCINFDSKNLVEPGKTIKIVSRSLAPFQGKRLMITDGVSEFTINDLLIGKNSQFVSGEGVEASFFSAPNGASLKMDEARATQDISLVVTNGNGEPARIRGILFGTEI